MEKNGQKFVRMIRRPRDWDTWRPGMFLWQEFWCDEDGTWLEERNVDVCARLEGTLTTLQGRLEDLVEGGEGRYASLVVEELPCHDDACDLMEAHGVRVFLRTYAPVTKESLQETLEEEYEAGEGHMVKAPWEQG